MYGYILLLQYFRTYADTSRKMLKNKTPFHRGFTFQYCFGRLFVLKGKIHTVLAETSLRLCLHFAENRWTLSQRRVDATNWYSFVTSRKLSRIHFILLSWLTSLSYHNFVV